MQTQTQTLNGLNLEQMQQTVEALQSDPSLARFEFRASNRWIDGGHNRSTIQGFYGAGPRTRRAPNRSCSTTASRPCCSATTRAPTRSSSCSTRSPAASRRPSSSTPPPAASGCARSRPSSRATSTSRACSTSILRGGRLRGDPHQDARRSRRLRRGDRRADRVHQGALAGVQHGLPPRAREARAQELSTTPLSPGPSRRDPGQGTRALRANPPLLDNPPPTRTCGNGAERNSPCLPTPTPAA